MSVPDRASLPIAIAIAMLVMPLQSSAVPSAQGPRPVSPARQGNRVYFAASCPTFSWAPVPDAAAHELVVLRLADSGRDARPVLHHRTPGSAASWTPGIGECLDPGRHVWLVRALADEDAGPWSPPAHFEVVATPAGGGSFPHSRPSITGRASADRRDIETENPPDAEDPDPASDEGGGSEALVGDPAGGILIDGVPVVTTLTDRDALGSLSCDAGQVPKSSGGEWTCGGDADSLAAVSCAPGQVLKSGAAGWECGTDLGSLEGLRAQVVVRESRGTVAPGAAATLEAVCASGELLLHGGSVTAGDASLAVYGSRPVRNPDSGSWRWEVRAANTGLLTHQVTVYAVCLGGS